MGRRKVEEIDEGRESCAEARLGALRAAAKKSIGLADARRIARPCCRISGGRSEMVVRMTVGLREVKSARDSHSSYSRAYPRSSKKAMTACESGLSRSSRKIEAVREPGAARSPGSTRRTVQDITPIEGG